MKVSSTMADFSHLYTIVLAGGSGTRFWPASRRLLPKQLLALAPGSTEALIADTVRRLEPLCPPNRVLVATGAHLVEGTRAALPWLPPDSFLGEPRAKNTAPCIAWATAIIARRDPEAVVMVVPSDHHIGEPQVFRDVLSVAVRSAHEAITTVGIRPARPETGYGYIEVGEAVAADVFRVVRFVEKPSRARAEEYLSGGRYLWNSGMFFFRAAALLDAVREHVPEVWAGIQRIDAAAKVSQEAEVAATREAFDRFPSVSIDYAVMEKASPLHVVPGSFGWSDLGSWESAWELAEKDPQGNTKNEGALYVDARNNLTLDLRSARAGKVLALVGVEGLCVVETDDALLVIPRERSQEVRSVVEALSARGQHDKI